MNKIINIYSELFYEKLKQEFLDTASKSNFKKFNPELVAIFADIYIQGAKDAINALIAK